MARWNDFNTNTFICGNHLVDQGIKSEDQGLLNLLQGNSLRAVTEAMPIIPSDLLEVALGVPLLMHKTEITVHRLLCQWEWIQAKVKHARLGIL